MVANTPATREREADAARLDERLSALAQWFHAGNYYEGSWQFFRFGQLKGMDDREAVKALAAWCKRQCIEMRFSEAKVRDVDVVMLELKSRQSQGRSRC